MFGKNSLPNIIKHLQATSKEVYFCLYIHTYTYIYIKNWLAIVRILFFCFSAAAVFKGNLKWINFYLMNVIWNSFWKIKTSCVTWLRCIGEVGKISSNKLLNYFAYNEVSNITFFLHDSTLRIWYWDYLPVAKVYGFS